MTGPATCYDHRARKDSAPACPTCLRIRVERDIVTRTVDALLAAGFALAVHDAEDQRRPEPPTTDRGAILAELMETDDDHLRATRPNDSRTCWVRFVYGNDGYDVINDYTTNLEAILAPVNAYADSLDARS